MFPDKSCVGGSDQSYKVRVMRGEERRGEMITGWTLHWILNIRQERGERRVTQIFHVSFANSVRISSTTLGPGPGINYC